MRNQRKGKIIEQDDDMTKEVHIKVAEFYGKLNPVAFLDWVISMEDYSDWYAMPKNRKVGFARAKLKGPACIWWYNIDKLKLLYRTGQPPVLYTQGLR